MTMRERCALVTGGSRGIGRAICLELARRGAAVAVNCSTNTAAAEETAKLCRELSGAEAIVIQADVSDPAQAEAMVAEAAQKLGKLDILVNNAGITRDGLMLRMKEEDWDRVLDTNLKSAFLTTKAAYKIMMKQKYGRIVNVSSIVGVRGNAGQANYAASKAGLIGLTKSVAKELAARNVTVNAVAPGYIDTDMTGAMPETAKTALQATIPMARTGKPEDVAQAVAFFAEEGSSYITGQVLSVDGGMAV